jgi:hypothetical protein
MNARDRYATPAAFRRALTDRLNAAARESRWSLPQLQRQVAYDRLIERLYLINDGWIVKGATALLARDIGVRGSLDIDLYLDAAREVAEDELRQAAASDIGDWFHFEIGGGTPIAHSATRLPVRTFIGASIWVEFRVDLVGSDLRMTGQPDDVPPLARGVIPEVEQRGYRAYPLVDHIADKVAAIYERHGEDRRPSTRYRDLVDLVAITTGRRSPRRHSPLRCAQSSSDGDWRYPTNSTCQIESSGNRGIPPRRAVPSSTPLARWRRRSPLSARSSTRY